MISVLFQTESHFPVERKRIIQAVQIALGPRVKGKTEVSISVVGDRRMRQLNRTYRKIDDATDVLSFPLNDPSSASAPFASAPDGVLRLGDVIVSLVLHGLDHLLGIHHPE